MTAAPSSPAHVHDGDGDGDGAARPRAVTFATVAAALAVPFLVVAGVVTSLYTQEIQHEWADRQREACRELPFPLAEYAAGWAGVVLGVAAVVVYVLLARRLRGRYGLRLGETWPGLLAGTTVWFCVLAIPMELIQLYVVHSAAAAGINLGDGC
ncbi:MULTISPECIES: hypothetical protein [Streptomyces]|uniref:hypothetical protein n=1 Tax=Streptomyces TaxID=1883 RepID=UPI0006AF28E7|nr:MULTISPECIES: hypothetical protein [unclassified Streptomyces]KOU88675.1 hypothetical protein ADK93_12115 [Streptomyces sp. XY58]KOV03625.1 hypothetical protein ADK89_26170 [Streptomyces sp. XY37]KOV46792.1 hypothetical protein ADK99_20995 [Streptomyces sp. MMG1064]